MTRMLFKKVYWEDGYRVYLPSNPANLGDFALVGNFDGQFAIGQLPHGFQDRVNAAADIASHIDCCTASATSQA